MRYCFISKDVVTMFFYYQLFCDQLVYGPSSRLRIYTAALCDGLIAEYNCVENVFLLVNRQNTLKPLGESR